MGSFHRTNLTDEGFIRGAARLLVADEDQAWPDELGDVIELSPSADVYTLNLGGATGGTFDLTVTVDDVSATASALAYNTASAALDTAIEGLSNVGVGEVAVTGTALPATLTLTFSGAAASAYVTVDGANLTGNPDVSLARTASGDQYRALGTWRELGATKTGIQIARNNAEEEFDVDQIQAAIATEPTNWEMSVGTALAEVTLEHIDYVWEGGDITVDTNPTIAEKHLPLGQPVSYTKNRLAVLFQRPNGDIRAYLFREVQRTPQESAFTHQKTGEQATLPIRWRCLADDTVADENARFGEIIDQVS